MFPVDSQGNKMTLKQVLEKTRLLRRKGILDPLQLGFDKIALLDLNAIKEEDPRITKLRKRE